MCKTTPDSTQTMFLGKPSASNETHPFEAHGKPVQTLDNTPQNNVNPTAIEPLNLETSGTATTEQVARIRKIVQKLLKTQLVNGNSPSCSKAVNVVPVDSPTSSNSTGRMPAMSAQKAEVLAKRLDVILFEKASSLQDYANVHTLEERLNVLLKHMLGRCIQRAAGKEHRERERALCMILGKERLRGVVQLVRDIKRMQLAPPSSRPSGMNDMNGMSHFHQLPSSPSSVDKHQFWKTVEKPVQDLFLRTPLVQVFDLTPTDKLSHVPWDELIMEGQQAVASYKNWQWKAKEDSKPLTDSRIAALENELRATAAGIMMPAMQQQHVQQ